MIANAIQNSIISRLKATAMLAFIVGGGYVYDKYDKGANYVPVQARATDVKELCFLERKAGRETEISDMIACDRAEAAAKNDAEWADAEVKRKVTISYEYTSPVDKKTHKGRHEFDGYPEGKKIMRGSLFNVRASKTDPDQSREI